jgi:C1A family cysteine protease
MLKFKWIPDLPDQRDHKYLKASVSIPKKVDLREKCSPVEDQETLGCCVGNSLVGAMEYLNNVETNTYTDLSRLFVYYNGRDIEGTVTIDNGMYIRNGIKTLAKEGVCIETLWPYTITKFKIKPSMKSYDDALSKKIVEYSRLESLDDMKNCLAAGFPFVFGFTVYEESITKAGYTGILDIPTPDEKLVGGHAVMAVGYDDDTQRFLIRNSWGPGWGDKGYFTIPYAYVTNRNLSDDFWCIKKSLNPITPLKKPSFFDKLKTWFKSLFGKKS